MNKRNIIPATDWAAAGDLKAAAIARKKAFIVTDMVNKNMKKMLSRMSRVLMESRKTHKN
jgi:hypothetical protein